MDQILFFPLLSGFAVNLLSNWLHIPDRVKLDSACCSSGNRDGFLALIRRPQCAIDTWVYDNRKRKATNNVVRWAHARNSYVRKIAIDKNTDVIMLDQYLHKMGLGVSEIKAVGTQAQLITSIQRCSNLHTLSLTSCELSPALVEVLCRSPLREFRCDFSDNAEANGSLSALSSFSCPALKVLSVSWTEGSAHVAAAVVKLALRVEFLILRPGYQAASLDSVVRCISPSVVVFSMEGHYMSSDSFCLFAAQCPRIQHLDVSDSEMTPAMVTAIGTHLTQLQSLGMSCPDTVYDGTLQALAQACGGRLTELLLNQSYQLTLQGVQNLLPYFTKLTSFGMHYEEGDLDEIDWTLFHRFRMLTLSFDGQGAQDFVGMLAQHCVNLRHLQIQYYDEGITGEDMDALVRQCSQLQTMNLTGSNNRAFYSRADCARWMHMNPNLVSVETGGQPQLSYLRVPYL